jgi:4-amino-4-deoxy-L-arabinose transferase-like glycosyltransferase
VPGPASPQNRFPGVFGGANGGGGLGGLLTASTPSSDVVAALQANAKDYTWVLATVGSNVAAGYQLAADEPVMAVGGFNGTDPSPTLAEFQALVAAGKIHYFEAGGSFGGRGGTSGAITQWVTQRYPALKIGDVTLYDLSKAPA